MAKQRKALSITWVIATNLLVMLAFAAAAGIYLDDGVDLGVQKITDTHREATRSEQRTRELSRKVAAQAELMQVLEMTAKSAQSYSYAFRALVVEPESGAGEIRAAQLETSVAVTSVFAMAEEVLPPNIMDELRESVDVIQDITEEAAATTSPNQLFQLLKDSGDSVDLMLQTIDAARTAMRLRGDEISAEVQQATLTVRDSAGDVQLHLASVQSGLRWTLGGLVLFVLSTNLVAFGLIRRRLQDVRRYSQKVANGDYRAVIEFNSPDQLGLLANDVHHMGQSLAELLTRAAEQQSETESALAEVQMKSRLLEQHGAALEHAQDSLKESEAQLKLTVQIAKLGFWHFDHTANKYLSISNEHAQIFGYTAEEFMERFATLEGDLTLVHPDDRARVEVAYERAYDERESSEAIDIDYRVLHRDGGVRHLREIIHLTYDASGKLTEEQGTLQDVTEFKEAQLDAERANRAKSKFLSRMSHELRTPMNAVLGFGRLLKADPTLSDKNRDFLDYILGSGKHLLTLIDEILDISKIESGRMKLSLETVEPAEVMRECMILVKPLAERYRIATENQITVSETPAIMADRTRLKQVLANLLSNAIKYNRENGRVTVSCQEAQGGLRISVIDTGQGLTEEGIAEIFEPFARLDAEQDGIEGTGIGLTITKRLVELMGGQLGVESTLGVGCTFWVKFPLSSALNVERVRDKQAATRTISTITGRILLAEDNPVNKALTLAILEKYDLEIDVAENGHEVVEAYLAQPYDLVLMDCQMPQMDGFEATVEIRRHEVAAGAKTSIPIIALTANAMSEDREHCFAMGMNDYLSKPFIPQELCEMLERWLPAVNTSVEDIKGVSYRPFNNMDERKSC